MNCPKCGSNRIIDVKKQKSGFKRPRNILYWIFIGWIIEIYILLFKAIFYFLRHKEYECQDCGHHWKSSSSHFSSLNKSTKIVLGVVGSFFALIFIVAIATHEPSERRLKTTDSSETAIKTSFTTTTNTQKATETTTTTEKTTTEKTTTKEKTTTTKQTTTRETTSRVTTTTSDKREYVLNNSTMKFHYPGCNSVDDILPGNRSDVVARRQDIIDQGYSPCGRCKP